MNASPLREGMPLFQHIDQQKKKLAHDLLFNTMQRKVAKALADHIQLIWQQNSNQFLELHRELTQAILKACPYFSIPDHVLDSFYTYMAAVENPFLTLCQLQEKLVTLFIDIPLKKLQDTWLDIEESVTLRTGNSQEKYAIAFQLMFEEEKRILQHLPTSEPTFAFFHFLGSAIGGAARQIHLQYLSEKIGFAPPLLGYFEELIQLSAFQQFLTFHEDMQRSKLLTCQDLIKRMQTHIDLFCRYNTKDFSPYYPILEELKNYFNSRLEKNKK
jgi:hypothetical protein